MALDHDLGAWVEALHPEDASVSDCSFLNVSRAIRSSCNTVLCGPTARCATCTPRLFRCRTPKEKPRELSDSPRTSPNASAELVLRESEERFRRLVNNLPDIVWTCDQQGRSTYVSSNVEQVFGYTAREICESASWWLSRIHTQDRERVLEAYQALFAANQPFDI
jgi:PAS domain-containing protein